MVATTGVCCRSDAYRSQRAGCSIQGINLDQRDSRLRGQKGRSGPSVRSSLGEKLVQLKPAEVGSFKIGQSAEGVDVLDDHPLAFDHNEILLTELLQRAANMRNALAERIANEFLCQRHLIGAFIC